MDSNDGNNNRIRLESSLSQSYISSRRAVLSGVTTLGLTATAGCTALTNRDQEPSSHPSIFVFNTGDGTVSIIDARDQTVIGTIEIGVTSSFPSNQYTPRITDSTDQPLWLNVGQGVRAYAAGTFEELARFETGSGANWLERTPDRRHVVVSAREPVHAQYRLNSDPDSSDFGEVTGQLDRSVEPGGGNADGPGPCDVTIHPDGTYAYIPDLYGDTLTVIDIEAFSIATQIDVPPDVANRARPWMGTASWDGSSLLVEHDEGEIGTESLWDLSVPERPQLRARLSAADGLGDNPLTSEIGPESKFGYVFTPGTEDVTVIALNAAEVVGRIDLGGAAFVGTWGPRREKLFVPVQTTDEVAVIDHDSQTVESVLDVGAKPYGATAAGVQPETDSSVVINALFGDGGGMGDFETTYCIGKCGCGHDFNPDSMGK